MSFFAFGLSRQAGVPENKKPAFKVEEREKKLCPRKESPPDRSHSGREPSLPCSLRYLTNQRFPADDFKYFSLTLADAQSVCSSV